MLWKKWRFEKNSASDLFFIRASLCKRRFVEKKRAPVISPPVKSFIFPRAGDRSLAGKRQPAPLGGTGRLADRLPLLLMPLLPRYDQNENYDFLDMKYETTSSVATMRWSLELASCHSHWLDLFDRLWSSLWRLIEKNMNLWNYLLIKNGTLVHLPSLSLRSYLKQRQQLWQL